MTEQGTAERRSAKTGEPQMTEQGTAERRSARTVFFILAPATLKSQRKPQNGIFYGRKKEGQGWSFRL